MADRNAFNKDSTTDEVLEGIDLNGKTVVITGGTSGLGAESARSMAAKGANVLITGRTLEKAQRVADGIAADTGGNVSAEEVELGEFGSIRAFAERVVAKHPHIDILINNAGVMACPYAETKDGFELQFGSNHLGHFLMTKLLMPALGDGSRVVVLSSAAHQFAPVFFDDIGFKNTDYEKWAAYGQSKTANALFAVGLNSRLKDKGAEAFSVHPGVIETELGRHMTDEDWAMFAPLIESGAVALKTVPQGAATQVYAATAPEIAGKGGAYLADSTIAPVEEGTDDYSKVRPYAVDGSDAERLWQISEEMIAAA
ncbi:MAG: SDR family NAD(P)-dependent oxidoreductase [Pseudomonadota bacterium]